MARCLVQQLTAPSEYRTERLGQRRKLTDWRNSGEEHRRMPGASAYAGYEASHVAPPSSRAA
jgi:hypothetical protein